MTAPLIPVNEGEVAQADFEAACELMRVAGIDIGQITLHWFSKAFARHRQQHATPALIEAGEVRTMVQHLRNRADLRDQMGYDSTAAQIRQAADMIERLAALSTASPPRSPETADVREARLDAAARALYKAYEETTDARVTEVFDGSWGPEDVARIALVAEMREWAALVLDAAEARHSQPSTPVADAGMALPTDRYGETAIDRLTDLAENGTLEPQRRADIKALLSLIAAAPDAEGER